eukprot:Pgem_evm1s8877
MFSNDPIENRFGDYRQHCGGETNIESLQVLQCELKKNLRNLYKKCSNSDGSINREQLAQHFIKFDSYQDEEQKNAKKQLETDTPSEDESFLNSVDRGGLIRASKMVKTVVAVYSYFFQKLFNYEKEGENIGLGNLLVFGSNSKNFVSATTQLAEAHSIDYLNYLHMKKFHTDDKKFFLHSAYLKDNCKE